MQYNSRLSTVQLGYNMLSESLKRIGIFHYCLKFSCSVKILGLTNFESEFCLIFRVLHAKNDAILDQNQITLRKKVKKFTAIVPSYLSHLSLFIYLLYFRVNLCKMNLVTVLNVFGNIFTPNLM